MPKLTLNLSPALVVAHEEAEALGISYPALLTADLLRYEAMARLTAHSRNAAPGH